MVRQGKGQHKIWDRQKQFALHFQPFLGLFMLAVWTMAIAAGVITVLKFLASRAAIKLSTKRFSSATLNGPHDLAVTGEKFVCIFLPVSGTIFTEYVCQF